jgi:hypothetical protein
MIKANVATPNRAVPESIAPVLAAKKMLPIPAAEPPAAASAALTTPA